MMGELDLRGARFGHLTVRQRRGLDGRGRREWLCLCSCGRYDTFSSADLPDMSHCGCDPDRQARRARQRAQAVRERDARLVSTSEPTPTARLQHALTAWAGDAHTRTT